MDAEREKDTLISERETHSTIILWIDHILWAPLDAARIAARIVMLKVPPPGTLGLEIRMR
jgi:hypothetical protein